MKVYTSYFYQIRFFTPSMIPLSTAMWDPKWFHDFKGQNHIFADANGVVNGLRAEELVPGADCHDLCRGITNCASLDPTSCEFLSKYREQLEAIDFEKFQVKLDGTAESYASSIPGLSPEDVEFIFIVHEAPYNPCSERRVIQEWLKSHNLDCVEWQH